MCFIWRLLAAKNECTRNTIICVRNNAYLRSTCTVLPSNHRINFSFTHMFRMIVVLAHCVMTAEKKEKKTQPKIHDAVRHQSAQNCASIKFTLLKFNCVERLLIALASHIYGGAVNILWLGGCFAQTKQYKLSCSEVWQQHNRIE